MIPLLIILHCTRGITFLAHPVNADSISVITTAKKLEILEQRMNSFELVLLNPTPQSCGGTDNESRIPVKSHIDNPATDQDIVSAATPGCSSVDETDTVL